MTTFELAGKALKSATEDGGWTLALNGEDVPTVGYVVGGDPALPERVLSGWDDVPGLATLTVVDSYMARASVLGRSYTGGWVRDDGALVLDTPTILADRQEALSLARERGEEAIYSLADGETIYV